MGLTIKRGSRGGDRVTVDRDLYLDAARARVVTAEDPDAAFLFCRAGREAYVADLERLGVKVPAAKKEAPRPANKDASSAGEDKKTAPAAPAKKATPKKKRRTKKGG